MKKEILITGGAGYIGSHAVRYFIQNNYKVVVLDNLITGHEAALVDAEVIFYRGSVADEAMLNEIFTKHSIQAVVHFAAATYVGESVTDPAKYYHNNVAAVLVLLDAMRKHQCLNFVFSSTCATYGDPQYLPLDEVHPQNPISPYGESKLMLEKIVKDYGRAYGFRYAFLRYFNACGAWEDARIGEHHDPETHLIPLILECAKGSRAAITVFGSDYDTPDGTCIRDYIHVVDLAKAHLKAVEVLLQQGISLICNLGTGKGASVKEVIAAVEKVTRQKVNIVWGVRRDGDPSRLVANPQRAKELLQWVAEYQNLDDIVRSAWQWSNGENNGKYPSV